MKRRKITTFKNMCGNPSGIPGNKVGILLLLIVGVFTLAVYPPSRNISDNDVPSVHPVPGKLSNDFQIALDSMRNRYGFPGATAAYMWKDGRSGSAATGLADVESGRSMLSESRMLAASIGKTFVGASAVLLTTEGVLDLDVPIARWLGNREWFARLPNHEKITLRHLLTHRSGLPNHVYMEEFEAEVSRRWPRQGPPFSPDSIVQFILDKPALFEVDKGWAYTDTGYILIGMIIEKATGLKYYEILEKRFLDPLNLNSTSPSNSRMLPGLASGYAAENAFNFPRKTSTPDGRMVWHPGIEWTGGGLVSTSADLARWGEYLFGGNALPDEALDLLLNSAPVDPATPGIHYGMGVAIYRDGPFGTVYGHGGWIPGYTSSLRFYKDYGVAIAFQINTDIGIVEDNSSVVQTVESRLAEVVLSIGL